jgi:hypothetical protein
VVEAGASPDSLNSTPDYKVVKDTKEIIKDEVRKVFQRIHCRDEEIDDLINYVSISAEEAKQVVRDLMGKLSGFNS